MTGPRRRFQLIALATVLAGCVPRGDTVPEAQAGGAEQPGGIVVAIRPVADGVSADSARARILGVFGAGSPGRGGVELIIRAEDGATVSVMRRDAGGLRPGAHVVLARGARTRIAP
jgi:hypothetical protein